MDDFWVQIATYVRQRLTTPDSRLTRAGDYLGGLSSKGTLRTAEEAADGPAEKLAK